MSPPQVLAWVGQYEHAENLVSAARTMTEAGYRQLDAYSPYPIEQLPAALKLRESRLPWLVLVAGVFGLALGLALQLGTNSLDYPWLVSGKPIWSWPSLFPVAFECTILFGALAAVGGFLLGGGQAPYRHPLDQHPELRRSTSDGFFLVVEARDPQFELEACRALLAQTGACQLLALYEEERPKLRPPRRLLALGGALLLAAMLPFLGLGGARQQNSSLAPRHLIWDMDLSPAYRHQEENPWFYDHSSARPQVAGTVAWGDVPKSEWFMSGKLHEGWAPGLPPELEVSMKTMLLGRQLFERNCAPCHGWTGAGDGPVQRRALALKQSWVSAPNLHQESLRRLPPGQIFGTISFGVRTMPALGAQLKPEERWAIVLYLEALHRSQSSSLSSLTAAERAQLK